MGLDGEEPHSRAPFIISVVAPNPGWIFAVESAVFGFHVPSMTCNMLGFGGCGVTKNHIAEAKFSQVSATSSGFSSSIIGSPKMALENAP